MYQYPFLSIHRVRYTTYKRDRGTGGKCFGGRIGRRKFYVDRRAQRSVKYRGCPPDTHGGHVGRWRRQRARSGIASRRFLLQCRVSAHNLIHQKVYFKSIIPFQNATQPLCRTNHVACCLVTTPSVPRNPRAPASHGRARERYGKR